MRSVPRRNPARRTSRRAVPPVSATEGSGASLKRTSFSTVLAENLAAAVKELALSDYRGVAHPVGPDYMLRIDFARVAAEMLGFAPDFLRPLTTPELRQPAKRPLRGGVDNRSTQAMLHTRLLGVSEGLERVRWQMAADSR